MKKLYRIVTYNLHLSRANKEPRKNFKPAQIKIGSNVLVRDNTYKAFEANYKDYVVVLCCRIGREKQSDSQGQPQPQDHVYR